MARHYMQDLPPEESSESERPLREERSIRDLQPSRERVRLQTPRIMGAQSFDPERARAMRPKRSRLGMWFAALIALVILCGAGFLILFPSTTITLLPHTQVVTFDTTNPLTAYAAASAAAGTIAYSVMTQVFEDSAVVQASGTEHAEEKATGNITIYNATNKEMRLIKNTRFQSADGLIFRIPASVNVPAMKGTAPGTATATVFADQTGPKYNIEPQDRFTLPGLKTSPDYTKIFAKSTAAFSGGFSGERPAVSPSILESTKADVRSRLMEKAQELPSTVQKDSLAFPGLLVVTFETLEPTVESGGGVRIHERARVAMPVFEVARFASSVAQAVSANAEGASVAIRFSIGSKAAPTIPLAAADLGNQPITFTLAGTGQLVWNIDGKALAEALAGKSEVAFQAIVKGFPSIEEAKARITPFWRHAFPTDASKIKVAVEPPPEF